MTKSKAKTINSDNTAKTTKLAVTAMLAALSAVLMFFDFPVGFIAPSFYEFYFSEVPVLVGTFSMGPIAGAVIEFVKILVKFLIKGTSTGGVGELANFLIGCSFILPAGFIYKYKKTRVGAIVGMLTHHFGSCFHNLQAAFKTYQQPRCPSYKEEKSNGSVNPKLILG